MTVKKAAVTKEIARTKKVTSAALLQDERNEKARKALEMRRSGRSLWSIAEHLGISERNVNTLISDALKEAADLVDAGHKRSLLAMEVDRLDELQSAVWQDAINGDRQAVETALKIIQARAKVLGLDNMPTSTITNNTIVVAGTSEEYVAALRRVAELPVITDQGDY